MLALTGTQEHQLVKEASSVVMLSTPVFIFTPGSSTLLGCPCSVTLQAAFTPDGLSMHFVVAAHFKWQGLGAFDHMFS